MPRPYKDHADIPDHCPWCGKELTSVAYWRGSSEHYDGPSEYSCPDIRGCGYRIGRWTGQIIPPGYIESRHGRNGLVQVKIKEKK